MLDLTNQRFGKLVAIRPTDQRRNNCVVWECLCDCGNTIYVASYNLTSNQKTSCGCNNIKRQYKQHVRKDTLVGQRFGKLVVLEATDQRKLSTIVWKCLCDCGNTVFADTHRLNNGYIKSCGCLKKENADKRIKEQAQQLAGQRFGRLTIVEPTDKKDGTAVVWKCKCDCGNTTYSTLSSLKIGNKKSCGCIVRERTAKSREAMEKELFGQKFGRLTVLMIAENPRNRKTALECLCDCGNKTFATRNELISGQRKSCGCLKQERLEQYRKNNQDIIPGQKFGRLTTIRISDERINKAIAWECKCDCGNLTLATPYQLRKGLRTTCGCMMRKTKLPDNTSSNEDAPAY